MPLESNETDAGSRPVATFEIRADGRLRQSGVARSLVEAAARLPQGAYTTLRTYQGRRVLRLRDHLLRLERSARALGHDGSLDELRIRRALGRVPRPAEPPDARLRLTYAAPRLFVCVAPFIPLAPELYRHGVRCVTVGVRREAPQTKDTGFIARASAAYAALPEGVHEGLLRADDGTLLEGLSSNLFAVLNGRLYSEESRALGGVTRGIVVELAERSLPTEPRGVSGEALDEVSEAFLTSASRGILPVVAIDDVTLGDGEPGPVTRALIGELDALIAREAEELPGP